MKTFVPKRRACFGAVSPRRFLLKDPALNEANLSNLKALLDIQVPDPVKEKEKEERKKQQEKEDKDEKKKDEDTGPPCGPVNCNEKIVILLQRLKPEIKDVIEQLNLVTTWLQLQIPRIEDGNNFGVAVQVRAPPHSSNLLTSLVHAVFHFPPCILYPGEGV